LKNVSQGLLQYVLSADENGNWTVIHMQNLDGRKIKLKKHTTRDKRKPKARAVNELTYYKQALSHSRKNQEINISEE